MEFPGGAEGIGQFQESVVFKSTEPRTIEVHRVAESGDSALAEATFHAVMRDTGARIRMPLALSVTVRDGKIVRFAEHFDAFPKKYFDGEPELGARDLLTRFWECFGSKDTDAALELLSWDCVYRGPLLEHGGKRGCSRLARGSPRRPPRRGSRDHGSGRRQ
jgi:hypothetical protein